ncbi:MAG: helix-turn-helix transcriptional regulator [Clostridiales bacterium]|nr:helix-turn-helix transcriptional regulator [Clostridiales bacterium]
MTIQDVLKTKNISIYRLSKMCEVPYSTLSDIFNGKVLLVNCSAETVYRLARALDVSMEELLEPYMIKRPYFENFKSTVCHRLKELGDIDFVIDVLKSDDIRVFYERQWYPESLYLLAMLDYISRENSIPLCEEYDDLRQRTLKSKIYPAGIRALAEASKDKTVLKKAEETAIPEFMRFNIVESEVRDVI